jgi:hypothetical protein
MITFKQAKENSFFRGLLIIALSLTILPLLGLIYAYCIWYIPFIYLNFILSVGIGLSVGAIINKTLPEHNAENKAFNRLLIIFASLIVFYFHWAVWVDLAINAGEYYGIDKLGFTASKTKFSQLFFLITNPEILWNYMADINKVGTWSLGSSVCKGILLALIWIAELIVFVWASVTEVFPEKEEI